MAKQEHKLRKGINRAKISPSSRFSERRLTSRAGLVLISRFMKKLGVEEAIESRVNLKRGENIQYSLGMIFSGIILGVIGGCRHLSHLPQMENDSVLMKIRGWDGFPVVSTITRVLERFGFRQCVELADAECRLRQKVWNKKWFARVNLDLDSTSKSAYGHQEGVARGHNTEQAHKPMLNPLFAFISQTGECLHVWLRPGNTASANGSIDFLRECLNRLPKRAWSIVVRADSAFFSAGFISELEAHGLGYVVKVKIRNWKNLCEKQAWRKAPGQEGVWTAEFWYQVKGWDRPRCFVAVRRLVRVETEGLLFPVPVYSYGLWVTNLPGSPLSIERFYNKRAVAENLIGAGKNQMAFGSMLVNEFWANHALLQAAVMAYNILVWFQRLVLDGHRWTERPDTLRTWLIYLAARLLKTGGRWVLALSRGYPYQAEWERAEARLAVLSL